LRDCTAGKLDDTSQSEADGSDSVRHEAAPQLNDFEVSIKADDIDAEGHAESMDAGRGFDPQSSSGVQTPPAEQPEHPLQGRVGQLDVIAYDGTSG
jgi:hypothetical protein